MLATKLNLSADDAERWIVNLIRNAKLDAKIDAKEVSSDTLCHYRCTTVLYLVIHYVTIVVQLYLTSDNHSVQVAMVTELELFMFYLPLSVGLRVLPSLYQSSQL